MKEIAILGSTGSVGKQALIIAKHLKKKLSIKAICAHSNIDLLEQQAKEFYPEIIGVYDKEKALELQKRLPDFKVIGGPEGIEAVASYSTVDIVLSAIVGTAGLIPTVKAIMANKTVALANKEVLVSAGAYIMQLLKEHQSQIIPVDSEHSALFQCLDGEDINSIKRLILTASGGPFLHFSEKELSNISVEQALKHPNWEMGAKLTIDCSTLMNKGCEVIEAHWLFDIPMKDIDVVIHPQSIIHSMVEFKDNVIMAQMGEPNMVTPIQYALTYPDRYPGILDTFDFTKNSLLQFLRPEVDKFSCLRLAYQSVETGGSLPAYMNAANEVLVSRFIQKKISWHQIAQKLEYLMTQHRVINELNIENILAIDTQAREEANNI